MCLLTFCLVILSPAARAYEYALQFTPNAGARGLVVAGYHFVGNQVVGNCSYYTVTGSSGKGGGGQTRKSYNQTCTWDMHGNLVNIDTTAGPTAPHPLSSSKGVVIYDQNAAGDTTGTDLKEPEKGFVSTPGGHYTWQTPMNSAVLHDQVYTVTVSLKSDGDVPVDISAVTPSALHGAVTLKSTTCTGAIAKGKTCSISATYDPTQLLFTDGVAKDTFRVDVATDAGAPHDFVQKYTILSAAKEN